MFSRNSQTPSLAITTTLSSLVNVYSPISGRALQPTEWETESPKDLVIASPGTSSFFSQTRSGPRGLLFWSLKESIRPPLARIRSASSLSSGLWSRVKAVQSTQVAGSAPLTYGVYLITIPLESPTLAIYNLRPRVITLTHVDPLYRVSSIILLTSCWERENASARAVWTSCDSG